MAKRQTKADVILSEARARAESAKSKVNELQADLYAAQSAFNAHYESLAHLEKALAPKPRKKVVKEVPTQKNLPTDTKEPLCGTCGNAEDYQDHFQPSPDYHEFEAPTVKAKQKLAVAK